MWLRPNQSPGIQRTGWLQCSAPGQTGRQTRHLEWNSTAMLTCLYYFIHKPIEEEIYSLMSIKNKQIKWQLMQQLLNCLVYGTNLTMPYMYQSPFINFSSPLSVKMFSNVSNINRLPQSFHCRSLLYNMFIEQYLRGFHCCHVIMLARFYWTHPSIVEIHVYCNKLLSCHVVSVLNW